MNVKKILILPKGTNRAQAETWLETEGYSVPTVPERCLHGRNRQGAVVLAQR